MSSPKTVIETSWEVANKVGGIYTVVSSKAKHLVKKYPNYLLTGPLFKNSIPKEFKQKVPPNYLKNVFEKLAEKKIICIYGTWLIPGEPNTILINAYDADINLNDIKTTLYYEFGIDSLFARWDFDEPLKWSWAVGELVNLISKSLNQRIVLHAHEWMAAFALLHARLNNTNAGLVFTTHATILGRTMSSRGEYHLIKDINPLSKAKEYGIIEKHTAEKACAQQADVFTTVSEITASEAELLLGKKPDLILYNGINEDLIKSIDESSYEHQDSREKIRDFISYFFFPYYEFNIEQSLTFFSAGRNEFTNKGMDVCISALSELNEHLKKVNHRKTIIMFFFVPQQVSGIRSDLLEQQSIFNRLLEYLLEHSTSIVRSLARKAHKIEQLTINDLLPDIAKQIKNTSFRQFNNYSNPPLSTHILCDESTNLFINSLISKGLLNRPEDKVKVIVYPVYLDGSDSLLNMTYEEVVTGCHLGIFPSLYEPWGYTPMESIALGVPAITSDSAGFGKFITSLKNHEGTYVIKRDNKSFEEAVNQLFGVLKDYCELDRFGRNELKIKAQHTASFCTWKNFINKYYQSHTYAYNK